MNLHFRIACETEKSHCCTSSGSSLVMKDESCSGCSNGVAPVVGNRFQNLRLHHHKCSTEVLKNSVWIICLQGMQK